MKTARKVVPALSLIVTVVLQNVWLCRFLWPHVVLQNVWLYMWPVLRKWVLTSSLAIFRYLHVSNLQVLLVILILKSHFYSKTVWMWHVFEGCMCGGGHFEKIGFRVFTLQWVVFPLILSNRRFKCTNLFQFWHRNVSNIGAPEETWNFNMLTFNVFCYYYFLIPCSQFKMGKIDAG